MAAIYKKKRDEIRIYPNRVPKKDGRNPILGWMIGASILFAIRTLAMCLVVLELIFALPQRRDQMISTFIEQPFVLLLDIFVIIFLGSYIFKQFTYVAFSRKKRLVYSGFLFFRRKIASFDELGEVIETQQEIMTKERTFFAVLWRGDKFKKPLRISPRVRNVSQLSRYYHEISPLVGEMLGTEVKHAIGDVFDDERAVNDIRERGPAEEPIRGEEPEPDDAEAVSVETVEVPDEDAQYYLSSGEGRNDRAEAPAPAPRSGHIRKEKEGDSGGNTTRAVKGKRRGKKKYSYFIEKKPGIYEPKVKWIAVVAFLLLLGFLVGLWAFVVRYSWVSTAIFVVVFLFQLRTLIRSPFKTILDSRKQIITLGTAFGFVKTELPLSRLTKIYPKSLSGVKQVCLSFKDQPVDPVLLETFSEKDIEPCIVEFGEIMDFDAASWVNRR